MNKTQLSILLILSLVVLTLCAVFAMLVWPLLSPSGSLQEGEVVSTPSVTVTPSVLSFMGIGDDFVSFQNPIPGRALFFFKHTGDGLFVVKLATGPSEDILVIGRGEYEGETTYYLKAGAYVLNITADGPWLVVIGLPE